MLNLRRYLWLLVLLGAWLGTQSGLSDILFVEILAGGMVGLIAMLILGRVLPGRDESGLPSKRFLEVATRGYLLAFFAYMFLPLIIMIMAAFNTPGIPQAWPMEEPTLKWFGALFSNDPLWASIMNSLIIGGGVVVLSVFLGLAGALLLTRLKTAGRNFIYGILVSPLLTPGIILGISTLVFWNNMGVGGGIMVAMLAQTTFIAAYCMLMFMARLQRFDEGLEEAALDLGASHRQVFWKITLPFLRPALLTGAVVAFLQSFENFNTTVFAIGGESTLTIRLASMARLSLTPEINALAVIFITLTVVIALVYELKRRAEKMRDEARRENALKADLEITMSPCAALPVASEPPVTVKNPSAVTNG